MENQYPSTTYMPQPANFAPFSSYSHQQPQHPQHQQQQAQQQQAQQQQQQGPPQQESSRDNHSHNQTLPPLHTQAANFGQLPSLYNASGSHPQTPTAVHTPTTSSMGANGLHAFSQQQQQQQQHQSSPATTGSMLPPSSTYMPYSTSQSTLPPASTATSAAQTPAQARLPDLRPLQPQTSYNALSTLPSFGASGLVGAQPYMQNHEAEPTHVVGSQGRRGILPSAPGRAAAPTPGTAAAATSKSMIPAKDADGKFPCPHCNKTYLHAKHLKRHLLRRELLRVPLVGRQKINRIQTLETDHTCAICARTHSHVVTFSSAIFKSARSVVAILQAQTISLTSAGTPMVLIACLLAALNQ